MTDKSFLTELVAELAELGDVTFRSMMGEYLMYLNGRYVAVICDNTLFVKENDCNVKHISNLPKKPPYDGAKPASVVDIADGEFLRKVVWQTYLGVPEKKKK